jgi:CspA family cold shock protein
MFRSPGATRAGDGSSVKPALLPLSWNGRGFPSVHSIAAHAPVQVEWLPADRLQATKVNAGGKMTGTIRTLRVDKGFGFLKDEAGKDYFFHKSAVYGEGLDNLREGDSVEFDVGEGPKGPRAENVRRTST